MSSSYKTGYKNGFANENARQEGVNWGKIAKSPPRSPKPKSNVTGYNKGYNDGYRKAFTLAAQNEYKKRKSQTLKSIHKPVSQSKSAKNIPKVIHQIWIGGNVPLLQVLYMDTMRQMNGWKYKLWGNESLNEKNFPKTWKYIQKSLEEGRKSGNEKKRYAQVVDLMRLEVLQRHGGVYVDTTMEALNNFNALINENYHNFIVSNEDPCGFHCYGYQNKKYISNSFIASSKNNPLFKRLFNDLENVDFSSPKVNVETGPYFLGRNLNENDQITMLNMDLIYPAGYETQYKKNDLNKCFKYEQNKNTSLILKGEKGNAFLQYPCKVYPKSIMIKHWEVGGTWK